MNVRKVLRWVWVTMLASSGCLWWAKRKLRRDGAVVALVFHRVLRDSDYRQTHSQPEILVRERTFAELAAFVGRNYEALDLHDAMPGKPSHKLKVVFTFDDGWWDNYAVVLPIVLENKIPLTVFLCPQLVGKIMPFWPERAIALLRASKPDVVAHEIDALIESLKKQVPQERERALASMAEEADQGNSAAKASTVDRTLSWDEIAQMDRAGVRFGSHTHSHEILTTVPIATACREVHGSDVLIERVTGKPCAAFSYPNGNWSAATRNVVVQAGFRLAVTTDRRIWMADSDPLAIPRSNVYENDLVGLNGHFSPAMFEYLTIWKPWRRTKLNSRTEASAQPQPTPVTL